MILHKSISLLALGAIIAFATPAFAQRDTRPDPDRPKIERPGNDERAEVNTDRLRESSPGMACELTWDGNLISGVVVKNDTGKTIKAGSVVTVYIQPGNIEKQYKVVADWYSGTEMDIAIDVGGVDSIAACSIRIKPDRADKGLPQPAEETPWYLQGDVEFDCHIRWKSTGPTTPAQLYVQFYNTGDVTIPAGTKIVFVLPSGERMTLVTDKDWPPNTTFQLDLAYSNERGDFYNESRSCTYTKVETGDFGPAVEEQGTVPKIDPGKIP